MSEPSSSFLRWIILLKRVGLGKGVEVGRGGGVVRVPEDGGGVGVEGGFGEDAAREERKGRGEREGRVKVSRGEKSKGKGEGGKGRAKTHRNPTKSASTSNC